jgi:hypothetical protein
VDIGGIWRFDLGLILTTIDIKEHSGLDGAHYEWASFASLYLLNNATIDNNSLMDVNLTIKDFDHVLLNASVVAAFPQRIRGIFGTKFVLLSHMTG